MSYPIQPVSSFGDSELYYIYQQLIDIANNTSGSGGGGATQEQIFEIFNGTNSQGLAESLFFFDGENYLSLANINAQSMDYLNAIASYTYNYLSVAALGGRKGVATLTVDCLQELTEINPKLSAFYDGSLLSAAEILSNIAFYTNGANNYLNSIDTKLTDNATSTLQTTGNASLLNIETALTSAKQAEILSTSTTGSIAHQPHNISFYNSGSAAGTLTVNGTAVSIPAGVSVNYDAGGNGCKFAAGTFSYNATGTTFIISYVR